VCGYVGSHVATYLAKYLSNVQICGIDNLSRRGSETNLEPLKKLGIEILYGDIRLPSDIHALPTDMDWVIDCAANPSVTAGLGVMDKCTPRQLVEHNLIGTTNVLDYCRERRSGLILLSTNRVYSISELRKIPLREMETRFDPITNIAETLPGFSENGVSEEFSTTGPISLYGATKLSSEILALEYGAAFDFPVWVNRCGVIGGPGQFGRIDQGIFSFWVYYCALGYPLKYIGYNGNGKQVRDCVLAEDIAKLVVLQMNDGGSSVDRITNIGGGFNGSLSLKELTEICISYFGKHIEVGKEQENRPYDIPYYITDYTKALNNWGWEPSLSGNEIIQQLCEWTAENIKFIKNLVC
jgi:CDP-paratose 2-epimerase